MSERDPSMQITIQLHPEEARHLHTQGGATPKSESLARITRQLGVILRPIHSGTADPNLIQFFTTEAPDRATAEKMIARLLESEAVKAAYFKPPDEMP